MSTPDTSHFTIIRASAGSGKTYRLMEILSARLSDPNDGLEPSQIIATTFTRKAAGELSERIQTRLLNQAAKAAGDDKARLQKQILALPSALIGTVNSVTDHLLRRYAVDAGLSPELAILSEDTELRAFTTATAPIIARYEDEHSDLLSRMEYDFLPGRTGFGNGQCWSEEIKSIVTKARAENLTPQALASMATQSKEALAEALGPVVEGSIREPAWQALQLAHQMATDKFVPGGKNAKNLTELKDVLDAQMPAIRINNPREPWRTWMAPYAKGNPILGKKPPAAIAKAVAPLLEGIIPMENAEFRRDVDQLIDITFAAAAECMVAFAEYKRVLSQIDFVDQERLALELISQNPRVQREIQKQFKVLIVDEFQDTSPIQLAFFMELSKYVEQVIWVGDPKQSIYGFRGADPQLMAAAVDALSTDAHNGANILRHSWRTHEVPLALSNNLFAPLFPNDVAATLAIPEAKREEHKGGSIQWWGPAEATGRGGSMFTNTDIFGALGFGLRTALDSEGPLERGRAILTRTNKQAQGIIAALKEYGIVCEGTANSLIETREGKAVTAGLALLIDQFDLQALFELISILDDHPAHDDWFDQLTGAPADQRDALIAGWHGDATLSALLEARAATGVAGLEEIVRTVIAALDLPRRVRHWSEPEQRMANLQSLCEAAADYAATVEGEAAAFSIVDFLNYLAGTSSQEGPRARAASQPGAVKVMTIWAAKGLEWDSVIVPRHQDDRKHEPVGMWVDPADNFDVYNPLADRTMYFWPATLLTAKADDELLATKLQSIQLRAHMEENQRVLYVALTRSRKETIILSPRSAADSLKPIASNRALKLADNDGLKPRDIPQELVAEPFANTLEIYNPHQVIDGETDEPKTCPGCADCLRAELPMTSFYWPISVGAYPVNIDEVDRSPLANAFADKSESTISRVEFPAARFKPSSVKAVDADLHTDISEPMVIGRPIIDKGGQNWDAVGNAVHAYLGVNTQVLSPEARRDLAADLVLRWKVANILTADQLLAAGDAWNGWVDKHFGPNATVMTEVPFAYRGVGGAHAQGWMDAIIVDESGTWHIIDHKAYPGSEPKKHIFDNYLGQMSTYCAAAAAAGHKLGGLFMHLPLRGEIYSLHMPEHLSDHPRLDGLTTSDQFGTGYLF